MEYGLVYIVLAVVFGLYMTWGVGANDTANAMGTSVGSGAITVKRALVIAAIFEFAGAVLAGGHVTSTIRNGIIDASFVADPQILIFGMLAALLAAGSAVLVGARAGVDVAIALYLGAAIIAVAILKFFRTRAFQPPLAPRADP